MRFVCLSFTCYFVPINDSSQLMLHLIDFELFAYINDYDEWGQNFVSLPSTYLITNDRVMWESVMFSLPAAYSFL